MEHTRGQRESMHVFIRREHMERLEAEGECLGMAEGRVIGF